MLEHLGNHENMSETGEVRANECLSKRQVRRHKRNMFSIFFNMKVCCMFSIKSSIEAILKSTHNIPFSI